MLDLKITGGMILDGTGSPAVRADVGVCGDRITAIGDLSTNEAGTIILAHGRTVCPGFIDAHSHSDTYLLIEPSAASKIYQGITTEIVGNCGVSAAPLAARDYLPSDWQDQKYPVRWQSVADYIDLLEQAHPAPNVAVLIGHGKLRQWVMGYAARAPSPEELRLMSRLLEQCMEQGGRGMSTGLIYPPGRYADRRELVELVRVVARYDGIYTTHMRSEGSHLLKALEEAIAIGREAGARVEISHLKIAGQSNWHLIDSALGLIRNARSEGLAAAADRYPYTMSHTELDVIFPDWAVEGGREAELRRLRNPSHRNRLRKELSASHSTDYWNSIIIGSTSHPDNACFRGMPLMEVAGAMKRDPVDAVLTLTDTDELKTSAFFSGMSEDNMWRILEEPFVMLGTDASLRAPSGPLSHDHPHPRAYGTFPRFLRASLDGRTVLLPEAVRKMTSLPAELFKLVDRGRLTVGHMADIVIFDPDAVEDVSTVAVPHQLAKGIDFVIVNGVVTLDLNGLTGQREGSVLR